MADLDKMAMGGELPVPDPPDPLPEGSNQPLQDNKDDDQESAESPKSKSGVPGTGLPSFVLPGSPTG